MDFRTVSEAEIKQVKEGMKNNPSPMVSIGTEKYPLWNTCTHTFLDLSHLKDESATNNMQTLSIKLPTGGYVTLCVIPYGEYAPKGDGCIDIKYYDDSRDTTMIAFQGGRYKRMQGSFYSLVYETSTTNSKDSQS